MSLVAGSGPPYPGARIEGRKHLIVTLWQGGVLWLSCTALDDDTDAGGEDLGSGSSSSSGGGGGMSPHAMATVGEVVAVAAAAAARITLTRSMPFPPKLPAETAPGTSYVDSKALLCRSSSVMRWSAADEAQWQRGAGGVMISLSQRQRGDEQRIADGDCECRSIATDRRYTNATAPQA